MAERAVTQRNRCWPKYKKKRWSKTKFEIKEHEKQSTHAIELSSNIEKLRASVWHRFVWHKKHCLMLHMTRSPKLIPAIAHTISHRLPCNFMHLIYTLAPKSVPLNIRKCNQAVQPTRLLEMQHLAIVQKGDAQTGQVPLSTPRPCFQHRTRLWPHGLFEICSEMIAYLHFALSNNWLRGYTRYLQHSRIRAGSLPHPNYIFQTLTGPMYLKLPIHWCFW